MSHVTPVRFTVAETVEYLSLELPKEGRISFRRLTAAFAERIEIIVHFLAVLELYKQGVIELDQTERFGDIEVTWIGGHDGESSVLVGVDSYEG
jgi:segregation and condensation protein A